MKQFGPYKLVEELASGRNSSICKAQNEAGDFFIVKVFTLPPQKEGDKAQEEVLRKSFYPRIELQKRLGEESLFVAPVLLFGSDNESAWFVTRFYPTSLQSLLAARTALSKEAFFTLIESIVRGTLDFKESYGRSHGNLKFTNIFLTGDGKNKLGQVLLSDPLPGDGSDAARFLAADLCAIGEIIYRLVNPRDTRSPSDWKISTTQSSPEWITLFGKNAQAGATLCKRLLDSDAAQQGYSLEKLLLDVLKLKPRKAASPVVIGVVCVIAALGVTAGVFLSQSRQTTITSQPESKRVAVASQNEALQISEEEILRLTEEKRLAEKRAEAEAKIREETRIQTHAELRRLTAEAQQAEERANKALAEARLAAEAAEKTQKEAAEKQLTEEAKRRILTAELEQKQLEAGEAAERAKKAERLRREAELQRLAEEEKTRVLTSELQRKAALQTALKTDTTRSTVTDLRPMATESAPEPPPINKAKSGERWSNSLGMKFVPIGNGRILFCIWETRRKDFEVFVTSARYNTDQSWKNTAFKQTPLHPVVNVSANDAEAFCKWLTETEREKKMIDQNQYYRLPSDEEWTAALGDSSELVYVWGSAWPPPAGAGNYATPFSYDHFEFTAPVAQFSANRLGIYDLGGNVWEICGKSGAVFARGGSWQTRNSAQASINFRLPLSQTERYHDVGFRCVLENGTP